MENIRNSVKKAVKYLRNSHSAPDFWGFIRKLDNAKASGPRLGHGKTPGEENVRFGQAPYLNFPPTEIAGIIEGGRQAGVDATVIVYFFGLLGVNGPMPREFTSYVFRRSHNYYDNTWRRFLDIIHHRFLSLYYRAFAANQQALSFDRPDQDPITDIIKALAGFPPGKGYTERQEQGVLSAAEHFSFLVKNRWGLEDALRRSFGFNLTIREFVPAAYDIPPENYAVLGKKNSSLGVNLQIGRTYMTITGKFEIHIGPLSFEEYRKFMSMKSGFSHLTSLTALYLDRPLDYTVVFSVLRDTIPLAQLGFDLEEARWDPPQLGYTCWIG
ncbi:MAG: type VI secretion system baseplate subunit TssG, partial [Treponema sp.]|nr:type VI secretion system baseplate subunit TssG [Treponema sp.]